MRAALSDVFFILLLNLAFHAFSSTAVRQDSRPHIVVVIVDDWGWNNWGYHAKHQANRKEIKTPFLDHLAKRGIVLDRHYATRNCGPSRASFWSGRNSLHINAINDPVGNYNPADPVSGYQGVPRNITLISEKMASAGYYTALSGKWDTGQATPRHFPQGRGFDYSLSYSSYSVDYWTYRINPPNTPQFGLCADGGTPGAPFANYTPIDLWENGQPAKRFKPPAHCSRGNQAGCLYMDDLFTDTAVEVIKDHNKAKPLFLAYSLHSIHTPLTPPNADIRKFNFIDEHFRRNYSAMANYVDNGVKRVVRALQRKGMWKNTLMLITSDNGGPIYLNSTRKDSAPETGGANNYPLRGGKFANVEGGVRVNSFITGGFVPASQRGSVQTGLIGIEDWYSTFCALANVNPTDVAAAAAGVPPIDSINMWPLLSGAVNRSPRKEVYLSGAAPTPGISVGMAFPQAIIDEEGYKLIIGGSIDSVWTGPFYPNITSNWNESTTFFVCADTQATALNPTFDPTTSMYNGACLFNVFEDPTEHNNIAAQRPDIVKRLSARLKELNDTAWNPDRGGLTNKPCAVSVAAYDGFLGPWLDLMTTDVY